MVKLENEIKLALARQEEERQEMLREVQKTFVNFVEAAKSLVESE